MIELRPSHIILHDYDEGDSNSLEKSLSLWNKAYFRVDWRAINYDGSSAIIPGGYYLNRLRAIFPDREIIDNRNKHWDYDKISYKLKYEPRDAIQQKSVNFLLGNEYSKDKTQKLLCIDPGDGKTFCSIYYIGKVEKTPIIIVDQSHFLKQWKEEFLKFTDLKEKDIFIIKGIESINKLITSIKKGVSYKVYIAMHQTLASYGKNNYDLVGKLIKDLKIGVKIFDEAHVEWKNIFNIDSVTDVSETIYLTATPSRSNPLEDKLYSNIFHDVVQYGLGEKPKTERSEKKLFKLVFVEYNTEPSIEQQIRSKKKNYGFDLNVWSKYIEENHFEFFFNIFYKIMISIYEKKSPKIVIMVHSLSMVSKIIEWLECNFPEKTIGNFTGSGKNKSLELNNDIIVTTEKSFGKGIDLDDLEVIFNAVPFSSKVLSKQISGRLRNGGIYFDMTDVGFNDCKKQRNSRRKVLEESAKKILEMKF
jgi:hypothetical protein